MSLRTFKMGGVHPPENKMSAGAAIETLELPKQVSIPLAQSLGAPAVPVVKKGDDVKVGTLIAKGEAFISANVHSSVSGKVLKIDEVLDASGYRNKAIVIKVDGDAPTTATTSNRFAVSISFSAFRGYPFRARHFQNIRIQINTPTGTTIDTVRFDRPFQIDGIANNEIDGTSAASYASFCIRT